MTFTPHDAARDALDRADAQLDAVPAVTPAVADDLARLAIVMSVSAIDTYMHRLVVDRLYGHESLPGGIANLDLPLYYVLEVIDESGSVAREEPRNTRPRVGLKRAVRERLLRETYQSYDGVSKALAMAGASGNMPAIGQAFVPALSTQALRVRLNEVVRRRNQVVHEGDYARLDRPQSARKNEIDVPSARDDVAFVRTLVDAIAAVI